MEIVDPLEEAGRATIKAEAGLMETGKEVPPAMVIVEDRGKEAIELKVDIKAAIDQVAATREVTEQVVVIREEAGLVEDTREEAGQVDTRAVSGQMVSAQVVVIREELPGWI